MTSFRIDGALVYFVQVMVFAVARCVVPYAFCHDHAMTTIQFAYQRFYRLSKLAMTASQVMDRRDFSDYRRPLLLTVAAEVGSAAVHNLWRFSPSI